MQKIINILNKRARFDYEIIDKYDAGIVLTGTEIKSIRLGKASIAESFCEFNEQTELFLINATIEEYAFGTHYNHKAKSERKLLLNDKDSDNKGLTIVPLKLYTNEKGFAKVEIALCRGKKNYDKRETMKENDTKRDIARIKKEFR
jgi:SsrA-binding protein